MLGCSLDLRSKLNPDETFTVSGASFPIEAVFAYDDQDAFLIQKHLDGVDVFSKLDPKLGTHPIELLELITTREVTDVKIQSYQLTVILDNMLRADFYLPPPGAGSVTVDESFFREFDPESVFLSVPVNNLGVNEYTNPTSFAHHENYFVQVDPFFASSVDPKATGGAIEVFEVIGG